MYIVTANEMQEMDRQTIESFGIPGRVLMEAAGRGATWFMLDRFPDLAGKSVAVVAGRGNNGGDGHVIARYLSHRRIDVTVYLLAERSKVAGDAAANLDLLDPLNIPVVEVPEAAAFGKIKGQMSHHDIFVDAILGTGLKSDVRGFLKDAIVFINGLNKPVFAVDMPSGLNSDTGQICGECIRADATATFAFAKIGHFIYPGAGLCGSLKIIDIGIPPHITEAVGPQQYLLSDDRIRHIFQSREPDAHKGRAGHLLVVAGSAGKTGAAAMTSTSAIRVGAGLVTLGIASSLNPILETQVVEAMTSPLPELPGGILGETALEAVKKLMEGKQCLALGPGLGQEPETRKLVQQLLSDSMIPMVIDADGLNNLAVDIQILKSKQVPVVLTPHPGEMARLLATGVQAIQDDRIGTAREFAVKFDVHVVLKGAHTVIAHPTGRAYVNTTGNAGMASGGMGDVLTGVIAGLIIQGYDMEQACQLGVYLHGAAADSLQRKVGPVGYLATEVMDRIPGEIKRITDSA